MTHIPIGSRVRYWPGGRVTGIEPLPGQTITSWKSKTDTNFGTPGYWVRKADGGTTFIAETHIEQEPDPVLFGEPEPPPTGVQIDADAPEGWAYPPVVLRAVADALRPFLAARVEPLEVAVLAMRSIDRASIAPPPTHEHVFVLGECVSFGCDQRS